MSDPYSPKPGWTPPQAYGAAPGPDAPPAAPQPYGSGYPTAQPYPSAQPYPAAQPYPTAQPYPVAGYPAAMPYPGAVRHSAALGIISLAVIVASTAASGVLIAVLSSTIETLAQQSSYNQSYYNQSQLGTTMSYYFTGLIIAACVGFAAWVVSIVAAASNRGRVAGIIGIILGVIAPIAVWGYFFIALAATVQHYAR
jgi:hypothetical protein